MPLLRLQWPINDMTRLTAATAAPVLSVQSTRRLLTPPSASVPLARPAPTAAVMAFPALALVLVLAAALAVDARL